MVRCKFICNSVTSRGDEANRVHEAEFTPVTCGSKENEAFFRWTPGGALRLSVLREQHFVPGREYYVEIHDA